MQSPKKLLPGLIMGIFLFLLPHTVGAWTYTPASHEDMLNSPQLSSDGKYLVTFASVSKKTFSQVLFFDTASSKPKWTFSPDANPFGLGISGNGKYSAVVGSKIWLLKKDSKKPVWSTKIGTHVFDVVALSSTGTAIAAGDRQSSVHLFRNASSKEIRSWQFGSEDGVIGIAMSSNGKSVVAVTHTKVHFLKTDKTREQWQFKTKDHLEAVRISTDGKFAVATTRTMVYYFDTSKKTPLWSKTIKSFYPLIPSLSDNGKVVSIATTATTYVFNNTGVEQWRFDLQNALKGYVALSGSGKYTLASQGEDFVYLFDNAYGSANRPIKIFQSETPRYTVASTTGSVMGYGRVDLNVLTPNPGILADQKSAPAYTHGSIMSLRVFTSNPGATNPNLKVKVALSLPQLSWWSSLANQAGAKKQTPTARSKALDYVASSLPGYSVVYDSALSLHQGTSSDQTLTLEVPSLAMPAWLADILDTLNPASKFSDMLGDWADPLTGLLGKDGATYVTKSATDEFVTTSSILPLLGMGTVTLYDSQSGLVYDSDSFYFIYGL